MSVWLLHHVHDLGSDREDVKLIGVYSSRENAQAAIARLASQPGFRENPAGFQVQEYALDRDQWREGFITVVPESDAHGSRPRHR